MNTTHSTRETWLVAAVDTLAALFAEHDIELPEVRVSCGWPASGGRAQKRKTIGQCWSTKSASDGVNQVFISPVLDEPGKVLGVLVHELIHAVDDCKSGHKTAFARMARQLGLEGKMTETNVGPALAERLTTVAEELGTYPHSAISGDSGSETPKKQGTRMLKCECPNTGYVVRTTRKWLDELGAPICPCCQVPMELEVKE